MPRRRRDLALRPHLVAPFQQRIVLWRGPRGILGRPGQLGAQPLLAMELLRAFLGVGVGQLRRRLRMQLGRGRWRMRRLGHAC